MRADRSLRSVSDALFLCSEIAFCVCVLAGSLRFSELLGGGPADAMQNSHTAYRLHVPTQPEDVSPKRIDCGMRYRDACVTFADNS